MSYTLGDRSEADLSDYFVLKSKQAGGKIWSTDLSQGARSVSSKDVDIIRDPKTKAAWTKALSEWEAIEKDSSIQLTRNIARIWDPRLEAIGIANINKPRF